MASDFRAGLDDDELSQFPSAASPLTAMGIDPDYARANPAILDNLRDGDSTQPAPRASTALPKLNAGSPPPTPRSKPADAEGYGMQGLEQLSSSMKQAAQAADDVPTETPQQITDLSARRSKLASPAPRFDPTTGKELTSTQEYDPQTGEMVTINPKASRGQKIWRGVRGGLAGLERGGVIGAVQGAVEPQKVGEDAYNAPSKPYQQAEQRRQQALGTTDTDLASARANWKEAVDASKAKASEFRANAALGKDLTTGATGLINAEDTRPEAEARKGKAKLELSQKEFEQRQNNLQTDPELSKLSPINKMLYMANGKVPDPKEPNEAEINAAQIARAMTVFKLQHGGKTPQSLEEFNSVVAAAKGELDRGKGKSQGPTEQQLRVISDKKNAGIEKANSEYAKRKYSPGAREDYQRQLQAVQNGFEEDMSLYGLAGPHNNVAVDEKGHVSWKPEAAAPPTAQPSAQPAPPAKPQPAPDNTRIKLQDGTVQVKRNGKWVAE